MTRARIRNEIPENLIIQIKDKELKQIGYMYFVEHISMLDIAFYLNLSEKTIQRRIKEIRNKYSK